MTLRYAILVSGSPYDSQAHISAQRFVDACYRNGHSIAGVFFYGDGVYVASRLFNPANDEYHQHHEWKVLAEKHNFPLQACVSVANKRGILNQEDSELAGMDIHNVDAPFEISGLGAWVETSLSSDRQLHFS